MPIFYPLPSKIKNAGLFNFKKLLFFNENCFWNWWNIWLDIDYFLNTNAQYLSRFSEASELLIDFKISSKEESEAIIELFHSVLKVFFLKGNRLLYSSSDFYFRKMIEAIYNTKWIPEDFDFVIGIKKSRLSLFSLRQKFSDWKK